MKGQELLLVVIVMLLVITALLFRLPTASRCTERHPCSLVRP